MKNLDNAYAIGDQFINDKSTEDEPGKFNIEAEVVSMVIVLILATPTFTATTATTTTTLPLLPPLQQQSSTDSELAARVTSLKNKFSDFEQKSNTLDNRLRFMALEFSFRSFGSAHKIKSNSHEVVKDRYN
ncbi:hypothetical protein Tco_0088028 [Tanacetum coccineum]